MPETRFELGALYRHSVGDKRLKRKMKTRCGILTDLKVSFASCVCESRFEPAVSLGSQRKDQLDSSSDEVSIHHKTNGHIRQHKKWREVFPSFGLPLW